MELYEHSRGGSSNFIYSITLWLYDRLFPSLERKKEEINFLFLRI
jgi:hypothetical protein